MNMRLFLFFPCILIGNLQAMDRIHEFVRQANPSNPERTNLFAIQRGQLGGTYVETQHIHYSSNQEFVPGRSFFGEMWQGLKSGGKQTAFDIGHCPGKLLDYGLQVVATVAVTTAFTFLKDTLMRLWNKQELTKQEEQQTLERLLAYYGVLQNLIKEHPRKTETEREEFRKLVEKKEDLARKLGARLASHMTAQEVASDKPMAA